MMRGSRCRWIALAGPFAVVAVAAGCSGGTTNSAEPTLSTTSATTATATATSSTIAPTTTAAPTTTTPPTTTLPPTTTTIARALSTETKLKASKTIRGNISPKSVVASGNGLFFAQNMMYRHTVTVYDRSGALVATIPDTVKLADFGFTQYTGTYRGAPVEAAFSPNGQYAYVTNYSMYGPGFGPEGSDECGPADKYDDSFVYRIDTTRLAIDAVAKVGAVPKYVAVSPDGRTLLVTNWCSYDLSIIDTTTMTELKRIPMGRYPRGIVVAPDSSVAYVAVMGAASIVEVDLSTYAISTMRSVGADPRHVVLSPDGASLYATLNGAGQVIKIDVAQKKVVTRRSTGSEPRSMVMAPDGRSLYVVNYESNTMSKLATDDLRVLQSVPTLTHPIGITVDPASGTVWVATYLGAIQLFDEV
ncbi:MAG: beta-propeller fold lactonase family protein [Acidimicrobiia bacterium]